MQTTTSCYAVPVADPHDSHSTPIFRNPASTTQLVSNFTPPVSSIYELFHNTALKYPDRKCLGWQVKVEDGITYKWLSYA